MTTTNSHITTYIAALIIRKTTFRPDVRHHPTSSERPHASHNDVTTQHKSTPGGCAQWAMAMQEVPTPKFQERDKTKSILYTHNMENITIITKVV